MENGDSSLENDDFGDRRVAKTLHDVKGLEEDRYVKERYVKEREIQQKQTETDAGDKRNDNGSGDGEGSGENERRKSKGKGAGQALLPTRRVDKNPAVLGLRSSIRDSEETILAGRAAAEAFRNEHMKAKRAGGGGGRPTRRRRGWGGQRGGGVAPSPIQYKLDSSSNTLPTIR